MEENDSYLGQTLKGRTAEEVNPSAFQRMIEIEKAEKEAKVAKEKQQKEDFSFLDEMGKGISAARDSFAATGQSLWAGLDEWSGASTSRYRRKKAERAVAEAVKSDAALDTNTAKIAKFATEGLGYMAPTLLAAPTGVPGLIGAAALTSAATGAGDVAREQIRLGEDIDPADMATGAKIAAGTTALTGGLASRVYPFAKTFTKKIATDAATGAADASGYMVGQNIALDRPVGENVDTSALLGGAFGVGFGTGESAIKKGIDVINPSGREAANNLIANEREFGSDFDNEFKRKAITYYNGRDEIQKIYTEALFENDIETANKALNLMQNLEKANREEAAIVASMSQLKEKGVPLTKAIGNVEIESGDTIRRLGEYLGISEKEANDMIRKRARAIRAAFNPLSKSDINENTLAQHYDDIMYRGLDLQRKQIQTFTDNHDRIRAEIELEKDKGDFRSQSRIENLQRLANNLKLLEENAKAATSTTAQHPIRWVQAETAAKDARKQAMELGLESELQSLNNTILRQEDPSYNPLLDLTTIQTTSRILHKENPSYRYQIEKVPGEAKKDVPLSDLVLMASTGINAPLAGAGMAFRSAYKASGRKHLRKGKEEGAAIAEDVSKLSEEKLPDDDSFSVRAQDLSGTPRQVQTTEETVETSGVSSPDLAGSPKAVSKGVERISKIDKDDHINFLNEVQRMRKNLERNPDEKIEKDMSEIEKRANDEGYEISKDVQVGKKYDERSNIDVINYVENENLPDGTKLISKVRRPQIMKDGKLIQRAQVDVELGVGEAQKPKGKPVPPKKPSVLEYESKIGPERSLAQDRNKVVNTYKNGSKAKDLFRKQGYSKVEINDILNEAAEKSMDGDGRINPSDLHHEVETIIKNREAKRATEAEQEINEIVDSSYEHQEGMRRLNEYNKEKGISDFVRNEAIDALRLRRNEVTTKNEQKVREMQAKLMETDRIADANFEKLNNLGFEDELIKRAAPEVGIDNLNKMSDQDFKNLVRRLTTLKDRKARDERADSIREASKLIQDERRREAYEQQEKRIADRRKYNEEQAQKKINDLREKQREEREQKEKDFEEKQRIEREKVEENREYREKDRTRALNERLAARKKFNEEMEELRQKQKEERDEIRKQRDEENEEELKSLKTEHAKDQADILYDLARQFELTKHEPLVNFIREKIRLTGLRDEGGYFLQEGKVDPFKVKEFGRHYNQVVSAIRNILEKKRADAAKKLTSMKDTYSELLALGEDKLPPNKKAELKRLEKEDAHFKELLDAARRLEDNNEAVYANFEKIDKEVTEAENVSKRMIQRLEEVEEKKRFVEDFLTDLYVEGGTLHAQTKEKAKESAKKLEKEARKYNEKLIKNNKKSIERFIKEVIKETFDELETKVKKHRKQDDKKDILEETRDERNKRLDNERDEALNMAHKLFEEKLSNVTEQQQKEVDALSKQLEKVMKGQTIDQQVRTVNDLDSRQRKTREITEILLNNALYRKAVDQMKPGKEKNVYLTIAAARDFAVHQMARNPYNPETWLPNDIRVKIQRIMSEQEFNAYAGNALLQLNAAIYGTTDPKFEKISMNELFRREREGLDTRLWEDRDNVVSGEGASQNKHFEEFLESFDHLEDSLNKIVETNKSKFTAEDERQAQELQNLIDAIKKKKKTDKGKGDGDGGGSSTKGKSKKQAEGEKAEAEARSKDVPLETLWELGKPYTQADANNMKKAGREIPPENIVSDKDFLKKHAEFVKAYNAYKKEHGLEDRGSAKGRPRKPKKTAEQQAAETAVENAATELKNKAASNVAEFDVQLQTFKGSDAWSKWEEFEQMRYDETGKGDREAGKGRINSDFADEMKTIRKAIKDPNNDTSMFTDDTWVAVDIFFGKDFKDKYFINEEAKAEALKKAKEAVKIQADRKAKAAANKEEIKEKEAQAKANKNQVDQGVDTEEISGFEREADLTEDAGLNTGGESVTVESGFENKLGDLGALMGATRTADEDITAATPKSKSEGKASVIETKAETLYNKVKAGDVEAVKSIYKEYEKEPNHKASEWNEKINEIGEELGFDKSELSDFKSNKLKGAALSSDTKKDEGGSQEQPTNKGVDVPIKNPEKSIYKSKTNYTVDGETYQVRKTKDGKTEYLILDKKYGSDDITSFSEDGSLASAIENYKKLVAEQDAEHIKSFGKKPMTLVTNIEYKSKKQDDYRANLEIKKVEDGEQKGKYVGIFRDNRTNYDEQHIGDSVDDVISFFMSWEKNIYEVSRKDAASKGTLSSETKKKTFTDINEVPSSILEEMAKTTMIDVSDMKIKATKETKRKLEKAIKIYEKLTGESEDFGQNVLDTAFDHKLDGIDALFETEWAYQYHLNSLLSYVDDLDVDVSDAFYKEFLKNEGKPKTVAQGMSDEAARKEVNRLTPSRPKKMTKSSIHTLAKKLGMEVTKWSYTSGAQKPYSITIKDATGRTEEFITSDLNNIWESMRAMKRHNFMDGTETHANVDLPKDVNTKTFGDEIYLHGSPNSFDKFKITDNGVFITDREPFATDYVFNEYKSGKTAEPGTKGTLYQVKIAKGLNLFDASRSFGDTKKLEKIMFSNGIKHPANFLWQLEGEKSNWRMVERPEFLKSLKEAGYDGYKVSESGGTNMAIFDPDNITIVKKKQMVKEEKDLSVPFKGKRVQKSHVENLARDAGLEIETFAKQGDRYYLVALAPNGRPHVIHGSTLKGMYEQLQDRIKEIKHTSDKKYKEFHQVPLSVMEKIEDDTGISVYFMRQKANDTIIKDLNDLVKKSNKYNHKTLNDIVNKVLTKHNVEGVNHLHNSEWAVKYKIDLLEGNQKPKNLSSGVVKGGTGFPNVSNNMAINRLNKAWKGLNSTQNDWSKFQSGKISRQEFLRRVESNERTLELAEDRGYEIDRSVDEQKEYDPKLADIKQTVKDNTMLEGDKRILKVHNPTIFKNDKMVQKGLVDVVEGTGKKYTDEMGREKIGTPPKPKPKPKKAGVLTLTPKPSKSSPEKVRKEGALHRISPDHGFKIGQEFDGELIARNISGEPSENSKLVFTGEVKERAGRKMYKVRVEGKNVPKNTTKWIGKKYLNDNPVPSPQVKRDKSEIKKAVQSAGYEFDSVRLNRNDDGKIDFYTVAFKDSRGNIIFKTARTVKKLIDKIN